ncbi:aspartate aminotransferase family protein, partial [Dolichospermum circinale CS-1225]|nr:aspartate aminotransferase family protein [Dolichospermum circinale CS-1225]
MSIQSLVEQPTIPSNIPFSADSFNQVVMSTYGRFPLALERGAGCRVL